MLPRASAALRRHIALLAPVLEGRDQNVHAGLADLTQGCDRRFLYFFGFPVVQNVDVQGGNGARGAFTDVAQGLGGEAADVQIAIPETFNQHLHSGLGIRTGFAQRLGGLAAFGHVFVAQLFDQIANVSRVSEQGQS